MRAVIAYLRVSTGKQGKSGLGIEAQRAAISRCVEAEGLELIGERRRSGRGRMLSIGARSCVTRWQPPVRPRPR
jgi:DNA invertase Pin-like site-specific DNA recombinase